MLNFLLFFEGGREGFIWLIYQVGQDLELGTEAEIMREPCLLP